MLDRPPALDATPGSIRSPSWTALGPEASSHDKAGGRWIRVGEPSAHDTTPAPHEQSCDLCSSSATTQQALVRAAASDGRTRRFDNDARGHRPSSRGSASPPARRRGDGHLRPRPGAGAPRRRPLRGHGRQSEARSRASPKRSPSARRPTRPTRGRSWPSPSGCRLSRGAHPSPRWSNCARWPAASRTDRRAGAREEPAGGAALVRGSLKARRPRRRGQSASSRPPHRPDGRAGGRTHPRTRGAGPGLRPPDECQGHRRQERRRDPTRVARAAGRDDAEAVGGARRPRSSRARVRYFGARPGADLEGRQRPPAARRSTCRPWLRRGRSLA